ncbi:MAG: PAS domain S-box protein [Anaerolineales bacterium]|uniref:PAS domain-containing protein n=1 Tax=Candidatus Villigracilis proximus TaxID=3140683 RepID=UPI0031365432|nr:PAS domain S-box protein [Anaerolineales bacterium]
MPQVLSALNHLIQDAALMPTLEYRFKHKTEDWRWVESTFRNLLAEPSVNAIVINFRDVTERKHAEERLVESEERLRLSLQAANQGLFDLDLQSGAAIVNREYAQMLGYDPETFVETHAAWLARMHPDDQESAAKTFSEYLHGTIPEYRVEFRQKTKDGHWKWILSLGKIVAYDIQGKPLRLIGTHTDINKRKQIEIALSESEEKYRLLAENISDVIFVLDVEYDQFIYVSPSIKALRGFTAEEVMLQGTAQSLTPASLAYLRTLAPGRIERFREGTDRIL